MAKNGGGAWNLVAADDPSDWKEEFAFLKSLDSGLRCDLCFDIYTAPVSIKDCSHTFCSACVRNAINKPGEEMSGKCPKCMIKNVYDSSLLPQPTLENVALQWRNARTQLYDMQQARLQEQAARASSSTNGHITGKRARDEVERSSSPSSPHLRRSKRSTSARKAGTPSYAEHVTIDDSSQDEYEDIQSSEPETKTSTPQPAHQQNKIDTKDYRQIGASDLVQCPMCQHTFTYRALNIHLDKGTCSPNDPEPSPQERGLTAQKVGNATSTSAWLNPAGFATLTPGNSSKATIKEDRRKKLVRPAYDMLKVNDIKRLLRDWQLNSAGNDRKRMVERHRKWINLFNANLDASEQVRKSNASLRQELEQWERAQDEASNGLSEKRAKTWAMDHKNDFATLAKLARETHLRDRSKHLEEKKAKETEEAKSSTGVDEGPQTVPMNSEHNINTSIPREEIQDGNIE
ncbi:uncharacterized protein FA14DRAFT_125331 [Meira miltonrushii]|uniref:RING-type domain-containing protein n=1 Tax=Meira miltonrushii TaxID=1280837 RepID=A0A316V7S0_9BASI|nr:uncharacterized protein FA14DRAFT_125331 [Meira miltonrushii]PWN33566.1 hypothetical protein FA14DRAFT_125331 [Meira miltonrushii]